MKWHYVFVFLIVWKKPLGLRDNENMKQNYRKTSKIRHTLVGNKISITQM